MARPKKTNASYFSHDTDMRNDLKIKAIRRKFGHTGYSVWNMLLEIITDSDNLELEYNDNQIELISADLDIETTELKAVIEYCIQLKLIVCDNGYLFSNTLKKRLEGMFQKRNRQLSTSITQKLGVSDVDNSNVVPFPGVIDDDNRQIKEKEIKVKEIKVKEIKHIHEDDVFSDSEFHFQIMDYFGFTEMQNPDKLSTLFYFLNILQTDGRLEAFRSKFESYKAYKEISKETKFGFARFLGTIEIRYLDGGWNAENWDAKLKAFTRTAGTIQGESLAEYNKRIVKQLRAEA
ncbi:MAG: DUF4373 domain-containing protein [Bacteroidota bacterium]|nr:DUF4373 domain-containing protein [Bacteroidota bacterium]